MITDQRALEAKRILSAKLLPSSAKDATEGLIRNFAFRDIKFPTMAHRVQIAVHAVSIRSATTEKPGVPSLRLRIYVDRRVPLFAEYIHDSVPRRINEIPVEVVHAPPAVFLGTPPTVSCTSLRKNSQRPAPAGISTSHRDGLAGTIGYFCFSTDPSDKQDDVYLLSNNHIYANWNTAKACDPIFQPATGDGGVARDTLAVFARCEPLRFGGPLNRVDAAIGKLKPGLGYSPEICSIGRVAAIGMVHQDQIVAKHGRSSGYTEGSITDELIDTTVIVPGKDSRFARFENQMRIEPAKGFSKIAEEGDSGSLVVDRDGKDAVGLLFAAAKDGSYAYANYLEDVLSVLRIKLI